MYDYNAKDQSMRIPPDGLVNWHPEGEIRNANVLSLIITLYVPSKNGKKYNYRPVPLAHLHVLKDGEDE